MPVRWCAWRVTLARALQAEIMVVVLRVDKPLGKVTGGVVVDIAQGCDTGRVVLTGIRHFQKGLMNWKASCHALFSL